MNFARTSTLGALGAAALVLFAAGCSNVEDAVKDKVDEAVAEATEAAQDAIDDVAEDDLGEAIEDALSTDDAEYDLGMDGSVDLPSDFPDELPLPDGTLTFSFSDGASWEMLYTIDDVVVYDDMVADFDTDSTYTHDQSGELSGMKVDTFVSDTYMVSLMYTADTDSGEQTLVYGIELIG